MGGKSAKIAGCPVTFSAGRRGFLGAILAAAAAPAIVRAASLMPVRRLASGLVVPAGLDFDFASMDLTLRIDDLTLTIDDFSRRMIQPALVQLARSIDRDVLAWSGR